MVTIKSISGTVKAFQQSDRDFIIAISGYRGEGKSTLSVLLGVENGKFDFEKNILYSRKKAMEKIGSLEHSTLVVDEAINILYRRDFMKGEQKELIKLMNMCRDRHLCLIFNIPNVWNLDKDILQTMVRMWIHVDKRGLAYCFVPDNNPFSADKWHRKLNEKLMKKWDSSKVGLKKSPNFDGILRFKDLDEEQKLLYIKIKMSKRIEAENEDVENEIMQKKLRREGAHSVLKWQKEHEYLRVGCQGDLAKEFNIIPETLYMRIDRAKPIQETIL